MATTGDDPDDRDTEDSPPAPTRRSGTRPATTRSTAPSRSSRSATPAPTKWAIDRLDSRERAFAFTASAFAVLFSVFIGFLAHIKPPKGQLHPETIFVVGMVGAALLLGATFLGRRAPVGFVALFIGASFAQSILFLGLPFFALAFWLLYRSFRVQKEITAQMRASRSEATSSSATTRSRSSSASTPAKSSAAKKAAPVKKRSKGPVGPTPNKRYTPKTPAPPPPPPPKLSRRERKAAASQD